MIRKGDRVIDRISGERGEVRCRRGWDIIVNWDADGGIQGEIPWPICDFVRETPKNVRKYCHKPEVR